MSLFLPRVLRCSIKDGRSPLTDRDSPRDKGGRNLHKTWSQTIKRSLHEPVRLNRINAANDCSVFHFVLKYINNRARRPLGLLSAGGSGCEEDRAPTPWYDKDGALLHPVRQTRMETLEEVSNEYRAAKFASKSRNVGVASINIRSCLWESNLRSRTQRHNHCSPENIGCGEGEMSFWTSVSFEARTELVAIQSQPLILRGVNTILE
ncbi:hypothetical protein J6590_044997 [Homalodisca vitripennis]|nr:hypothetical protein J6590_044997 [Homalodisca vitripennis]